jgi:riboflavin biosynthesis pyrimidine reductase
VVATRSGDLPLDSRLFASTAEGPVVVLAERMDGRRREALAARGVEVVAPHGGLEAALRQLARRGVLDILCEGGPSLAAGLLAADLLDRVALFVAPLVLGRGAPDLLALPAPTKVDEGIRLRDVAWQHVGADLLIEGRLDKRSHEEG